MAVWGGAMKKTHREKISQIVADKGLYSIMNSTKWRELKRGVAELPFHPPFVIKFVDEDESPSRIFDEDVTYLGDWGLDFENRICGDMYATPFYAVEWIKVRPRYLETWPHRLMPDPKNVAADATEQFVDILTKYNIPYEEDNGAFAIYGYKK